MKTRDTEYLYASMRVKSLEKNLLSDAVLDALIDTATLEDMAKVLTSYGYGELQSVSPSEIEKALASARRETFETLAEISPNKAVCDIFRMKYDYHNIKVILKSDMSEQAADHLLSNAGRYSAKDIQSAIHQGDLKNLPQTMQSAILEAREILSRTNDAQSCDFILDRAYFEEMKTAAEKSNDHFIKGYVLLLIDVLNLRAATRALRQKKDADFINRALIDGGNISKDRVYDAYLSGTISEVYARTSLEEAATFTTPQVPLGEFERLCDNAVMKYLKSAKYIAFGEAPLVAYIAAREADITAIRIITAGKTQCLARDEIRERLRDCYV